MGSLQRLVRYVVDGVLKLVRKVVDGVDRSLTAVRSTADRSLTAVASTAGLSGALDVLGIGDVAGVVDDSLTVAG